MALRLDVYDRKGKYYHSVVWCRGQSGVLGLVLLVGFNLKIKNKIAPGNVLMIARGGNKKADRIIENST